MPDERVVQQVSGILAMNDVRFRTDESKQTFYVRWGSTGIMVSFVDVDDRTLVSLRAIVLEQVDTSDEHRQTILEAVNDKNRSAYFGTFYLVPEEGYIMADYHLPAEQLQESELIGAFTALAAAADRSDDELREAIGSGKRGADVWEAASDAASEAEAAGPVVET